MYGPNNLKQLRQEYAQVDQKYGDLMLATGGVTQALKNEQAKEYMLHGVGRRWSLLHACIHNIFSVFPPDASVALTHDQLLQVCIPLHAYFINLFGISDNLAWVITQEKDTTGAINKFKVGLVIKETQALMQTAFKDYLNTPVILKWHNEHLKEYRDALAHRIPLYVPPGLTEEGKSVPLSVFTGSITQDKGNRLHAQILADYNTIAEIMEKCFASEFPINQNVNKTRI